MIISKKYSLPMRKDMTCKVGTKVIEMTKDMSEEEVLPVKLLIGKEKKAGKWPVYLEEEDSANMVAKINDVIDDETGEVLPDSDIEAIIAAGNYKIEVAGPQTNDITASLLIYKDESSVNQSSDKEVTEDIKAEVERIVHKGLSGQEEMDRRIAYMMGNGVDTFLILRVLRGYRHYAKAAHTPSCIYIDPYLEASKKEKVEGIIAEGLRAAVSRQALICEGEKSTGKNVYLETISWLLGMPMYLITFSRQMSPSSIYGEKTTDNSAANELAAFDQDILTKAEVIKEKMRFAAAMLQGKSCQLDKAIEAALSKEDREILEKAKTFEVLKAKAASVNIVIDQSELYDWLTDGGLMCFNEMNMAEANFFASFTNQLLDGTGFLFIPGRGEVNINPDCVLFGTQNADYEGVEQQNEATMSRFGCIEFRQPVTIKGQLREAVNSRLKKDGFEAEIPDKYLTEAEAFYVMCQGAVRKAQVSNAVQNIRGFVRALTTVAESDGYASLKRQVGIHVINTCPMDERQALYDILENVITL